MDIEGDPAVTVAHEVMREHLACSVDTCDDKAAAWALLIDAGRITPDPDRWGR